MVIAPRSSEQMNNRPILSPGSSHSLLKYNASVCPQPKTASLFMDYGLFFVGTKPKTESPFFFFLFGFSSSRKQKKKVKKI